MILLRCSTLKSNCPVFVRLLAAENHGTAVLRVTKVELEHNHELSREMNAMLPQNRRLTPQEQSDVQALVTKTNVAFNSVYML